MKTTFLILFFGFSILSYSQNPHYESWKNLAKDNISLQPEYGNAIKTEQQIKSDNDFIEDILQYYNSKEEASAEMLKLGMNYLYEKDRKSTRLNSSHVRISYAVFCLK